MWLGVLIEFHVLNDETVAHEQAKIASNAYRTVVKSIAQPLIFVFADGIAKGIKQHTAFV